MNTLNELLTDTFIKAIKSTMFATYSRKELKDKDNLTICDGITGAVPNLLDSGVIIFIMTDDTIKKGYLNTKALINIYHHPKTRHELLFKERIDKLLGERASDMGITNHSYLKALDMLNERKQISDLNTAQGAIKIMIDKRRARTAA